MGVMIPDPLAGWLQAQALAQGRSVSSVVRQAIRQAMRRSVVLEPESIDGEPADPPAAAP